MKNVRFILFMILSVLSLCSCNKKQEDYVIRNVRWGMTSEQVSASEENFEDTGPGVKDEDNKYVYLNAKMYDLLCTIVYEFNEKDELIQAGFEFNEFSRDNLDFIKNRLSEDYGASPKETRIGGVTVYGWETEKSSITLVYMENDILSEHYIAILFTMKD